MLVDESSPLHKNINTYFFLFIFSYAKYLLNIFL